VLLSLLASGAQAKGKHPDVQAETRYATAQAMLRAGQLSQALDELNKVITAFPEWPDPYELRSQIYQQRAGPNSTLQALATVDSSRDYVSLADDLGQAASDLEHFLKLQSEVIGRAQILETIGDLRARQTAAESNAKSIADVKAKEAAAKKAEEDKRKAEQKAAEEKARADEEAREKAEEEKAEREAEAKKQAEIEKKKQAKLAVEKAARADWQARRDNAEYWRDWGFVSTGVGAGLGGLAAVFAWAGAHNNSAIKSGGYSTASDIQGAVTRGSVFNGLGWTCAALGVVGLSLGAPLVAFNPDPGEYQAGLVFGPNGASLTVAWR
jgi:colicin import membrane protein